MLQAGWLILHLIASAMSTSGAATAAGHAGGVSCTYQACMTKCTRLNGAICNSYCDSKVRQRVAAGICTAQDDERAAD